MRMHSSWAEMKRGEVQLACIHTPRPAPPEHRTQTTRLYVF